jgi:hypothetical protein
VSRRRGTGSIFRKPGCKTWVTQFYKHGRRIREASGLTVRAAAQRRLTTRLFQVDRNELAARERKPVRIEELFAALEEHNLSNRKSRPRELPVRWRHFAPKFGVMPANNLTTDDVRHYIRERQQEGASNATIKPRTCGSETNAQLRASKHPTDGSSRSLHPDAEGGQRPHRFRGGRGFPSARRGGLERWLRTFLELACSYGGAGRNCSAYEFGRWICAREQFGGTSARPRRAKAGKWR